MALKNSRIAQANPTAPANDAYIAAVYREQFGRSPTPQELARFRGKPVKDVANIVLRNNSPFTSVASVSPAQPPVDEIGALIGAANIKTPEQLTAEAQNLYNPYFEQQLAELNAQSTLDTTRTTEDQQLQQQLDALNQQDSLNQAMGGYNNQFGDVFGSPLQQKLEADRLQQQALQQTNSNRQFERRKYDIGEILRKGIQNNTYGKQQAIGEYVASNQFSGLSN